MHVEKSSAERANRWIYRTAPLWLCTVVAWACSSGVTDTPPSSGGPDSTAAPPSGVVPRTSLTIRVEVDPLDRALASALGISPAGLTVRLSRRTSLEPPRTAVTDGSGSVRFDQLLDGTYTATVERTLSPAEVARLDASDRDVTIMAGGVVVPVTPPNAPVATLSLVGARRGGLVISEMHGYHGNPPYNWSHYTEIYNNSDSTLYLDGYVLAHTPLLQLHGQSFANCDDPSLRRFRDDTLRLWTMAGIRFPGGGRDFPIRPGEARIYAQDAADHVLASGRPGHADLSFADFEHVGIESDTDNPLAANVEPLFGVETGSGGRGLRGGSASIWFLARPEAVQRARLDSLFPLNPPTPGAVPPRPRAVYGIPRELIADVFPLYYSPEKQAWLRTANASLLEHCRPFVQPVFDRAEAELQYEFAQGVMRRRSLGQTMDGREILMRTKTAARDWEFTQTMLSRWRRAP